MRRTNLRTGRNMNSQRILPVHLLQSWNGSERPNMGKKKKLEKFKWETCAHVQSIGEYAVFVKPTCRSADLHRPRGISVVAKHRCLECPHWEPKQEV